jgi:hypothetical protein
MQETLTLGELRQTAELTERQLVSAGVITEEVVALRRPGAPAYPDEGVPSWLRYYNWLGIMTGRRTPDPDRSPAAADEAKRALSEASANVPREVRLSSGQVVAVYPKSLFALEWLESLDHAYLSTVKACAEASALAVPADRTVAMLGPLELGLARRLWAWVLTHPEPGLPFADIGPKPEPPAWTAALQPEDVLALFEAHRHVHHTTLSIISTMFPREPDAASRLPLHGFLAAEARDRGARSGDLLRNWALGEIFATSVSAAELQREAMERAKADRGADT